MNPISWAASGSEAEVLRAQAVCGVEAVGVSSEAGERRGQEARVPDRSREGRHRVAEPGGFDWQACFDLGQRTPTLLRLCVLGASRGPGRAGDLSQPHSCFLTGEKEPQLLLSSMLSPQKVQPQSFKPLSQTSQLLWLLATSERRKLVNN